MGDLGSMALSHVPIWFSTNHRMSCRHGLSPFLLTRRTMTALLDACM